MSNVFRNGEKAVYPIIFEVNYGQMKSINCYLYDDGQTLTLIDAGINFPAYSDFFDAKLAEYGFKLEDIDQIFLTHHHGDHVGLVNRLIAHKDMPIYAHHSAIERLHLTEEYQLQKRDFFMKIYEEYGGQHLAKPRLEKMAKTLEQTELLKIKAPITALQDGDVVQGLQVKEVPGHSPDSILFYDAQAKWLFSGDIVLHTGTTNALIDHDQNGELLPTVKQYRQSLEMCLTYDVEMVFAGHQRPFSNLTEIVEKNLDRMAFKLNRITEKVAAGHDTVLAIATAIYGERLEKEFPLIISEVIGYMTYAEMQGHIKKQWQSTEWKYSIM